MRLKKNIFRILLLFILIFSIYGITNKVQADSIITDNKFYAYDVDIVERLSKKHPDIKNNIEKFKIKLVDVDPRDSLYDTGVYGDSIKTGVRLNMRTKAYTAKITFKYNRPWAVGYSNTWVTGSYEVIVPSRPEFDDDISKRKSETPTSSEPETPSSSEPETPTSTPTITNPRIILSTYNYTLQENTEGSILVTVSPIINLPDQYNIVTPGCIDKNSIRLVEYDTNTNLNYCVYELFFKGRSIGEGNIKFVKDTLIKATLKVTVVENASAVPPNQEQTPAIPTPTQQPEIRTLEISKDEITIGAKESATITVTAEPQDMQIDIKQSTDKYFTNTFGSYDYSKSGVKKFKVTVKGKDIKTKGEGTISFIDLKTGKTLKKLKVTVYPPAIDTISGSSGLVNRISGPDAGKASISTKVSTGGNMENVQKLEKIKEVIPPTVKSIKTNANKNKTVHNGNYIKYTINFSQEITKLTEDAIKLTGGGKITDISGKGKTWKVTVLADKNRNYSQGFEILAKKVKNRDGVINQSGFMATEIAMDKTVPTIKVNSMKLKRGASTTSIKSGENIKVIKSDQVIINFSLQDSEGIDNAHRKILESLCADDFSKTSDISKYIWIMFKGQKAKNPDYMLKKRPDGSYNLTIQDLRSLGSITLETAKGVVKDQAENNSPIYKDLFSQLGVTMETDNGAPTITTVSIKSDNKKDTRLAKNGDKVILTMVSKTNWESLVTKPTVTIGGKTATVTGSGKTWTAELQIGKNENTIPEGLLKINISGYTRTDLNNPGTTLTETSDNSNVYYDRTAPTLEVPMAYNHTSEVGTNMEWRKSQSVKAVAKDNYTTDFSKITCKYALKKVGSTSVGTSTEIVNGTEITLDEKGKYTGKYIVQYEFTDEAGNVTTMESGEMWVDNSAPTISFANHDGNGNGDANLKENALVKVTAKDNESGIAELKYSWVKFNSVEEFNTFNKGEHTLDDLSTKMGQSQTFTNNAEIPSPEGVTGIYSLFIYAKDYLENKVIVYSNYYNLGKPQTEEPIYEVNNKVVSKVLPGTDITEFIENLNNNNLDTSSCELYDKDGNLINQSEYATTTITTNSSIKIGNDTYKIAVTGDLNEDGIIDGRDLMRMRLVLIESMELSEIQEIAADMDNDNRFTGVDLRRMRLYIMSQD